MPGSCACGSEIRVDRNPAAFAFAGEHARPTRPGTGAPVAADPD